MQETASNPEIRFEAAESTRDLCCPVCGEEVGPAPTNCPTCETPHHFDCWEYNGGCGVFGCKVKPRERPAPEPNTVDLPAKLGMPHKRTGTYAGVWWVPPMAAAASVVLEFMAIGALASGAPGWGAAYLAAMVACLVWIAFSSVHYYIDFETMRITKAKAFMGRDLLEWRVASLDDVVTLEVRRLENPFQKVIGGAPGSQDVSALAREQYHVVAHFATGWRFPLELAPPMLFSDPVMREVADLFRRVEASGAFPVRMDHATRTLPPPARNTLLLESAEASHRDRS